MDVVSLRKDLENLLNMHSAENGSNTPDVVLGGFLDGCLKAFDAAVNDRERHYGRLFGPPAKGTLKTVDLGVCKNCGEKTLAIQIQEGSTLRTMGPIRVKCANCDQGETVIGCEGVEVILGGVPWDLLQSP